MHETRYGTDTYTFPCHDMKHDVIMQNGYYNFCQICLFGEDMHVILLIVST